VILKVNGPEKENGLEAVSTEFADPTIQIRTDSKYTVGELDHQPPGPEPRDQFTKSWLWRHLQSSEHRGIGQFGQP
jgi:hypothetical protein